MLFPTTRGCKTIKRTEDHAALRRKSGPRRRRRGNTSYKDEIHVDGSVITERLYMDVKRDFIINLFFFSSVNMYHSSFPSQPKFSKHMGLNV